MMPCALAALCALTGAIHTYCFGPPSTCRDPNRSDASARGTGARASGKRGRRRRRASHRRRASEAAPPPPSSNPFAAEEGLRVRVQTAPGTRTISSRTTATLQVGGADAQTSCPGKTRAPRRSHDMEDVGRTARVQPRVRRPEPPARSRSAKAKVNEIRCESEYKPATCRDALRQESEGCNSCRASAARTSQGPVAAGDLHEALS